MTFKEIADKKVAGIPVLYLGAAGVIVLAVVAWRMRPTPTPKEPEATDPGSDAEVDENGLAVPGSNPYAGLSSNGTVTVVQQPSDPDAVVSNKPANNEEWARAAAEWLTATRNIPGADAMAALTKYLEGHDRSFQEQEWVNAAIAEKGQPPQAATSGGSVAGPTASKQITPPGYHVVKSGSDNTYAKLATLYYASAADDRIDLLEAANYKALGFGPFPTGSKVMIPAYHAPVYYTVTAAKGMSASQIAAANGITLDQLALLNDPRGQWYNAAFHYGKNARLRVS